MKRNGKGEAVKGKLWKSSAGIIVAKFFLQARRSQENTQIRKCESCRIAFGRKNNINKL